jgi:hypothetical protein
MRPNVPSPTVREKKIAHVEVTIRPIGKTPKVVPGMTNGAADATMAEADAAA